MERHIARCAYWLGVVCLVISFVWRVVQLWVGPVRGINLAPMTLYKGSLLFFVAAIVTSTLEASPPLVRTPPVFQTLLQVLDFLWNSSGASASHRSFLLR